MVFYKLNAKQIKEIFWDLKILFIFLGLVIIFCLLALGWWFNDIYQDYSTERDWNGLRFTLNNNHIEAINHAQEYDKKGNWVCVNIRGMKPKRAFEICQHEVGHEIFAEYCEKTKKGFEKCMGVVENE